MNNNRKPKMSWLPLVVILGVVVVAVAYTLIGDSNDREDAAPAGAVQSQEVEGLERQVNGKVK